MSERGWVTVENTVGPEGVQGRLTRGGELPRRGDEPAVPLKPRREGAVFDGFISNLATDRFPFEEIAVPTMVINARDDTVAPYRFAAEAAARIP